MRPGPIRVAAVDVSHWHSLRAAADRRLLAGMPEVQLVGVHDPSETLIDEAHAPARAGQARS